MSSFKNLIAIHFSAYCLTNFGQTVCIVGNCPQMGMWDSKKGLKLQTNPRQYPIWFSKKPLILQKLTNLEYKLCILDKQGTVLRWENLRQNRNLSLKTSCSIFLTEGEYQAQYDFQNSDSNSTHKNSTRKTHLSEIQEQSEDDDQTNSRNSLKKDQLGDQRKRSGSSKGRNSTNSQEQDGFSDDLIKMQSETNY